MSLESCGGRISSRLLFLRQLSRQAGTWQYVTASNPPAERVAPAVIDAQQRIWIFGGLRYARPLSRSRPQGQSVALRGMKTLFRVRRVGGRTRQ